MPLNIWNPNLQLRTRSKTKDLAIDDGRTIADSKMLIIEINGACCVSKGFIPPEEVYAESQIVQK